MTQRRRSFALLTVLFLAATACSSGGDDDGAQSSTSIERRLEDLAGAGVYIGGVAYTNIPSVIAALVGLGAGGLVLLVIATRARARRPEASTEPAAGPGHVSGGAD